MSDAHFDASWLALREAVDHRSRSAALLAPLAEAWRLGAWRRVVDLGSGTGSNLRYLSPRLPSPQSWTLVDHDASLLARAVRAGTRAAEGSQGSAPGPSVELAVRTGGLEDVGLEAAGEADLVTASALLDLVSETWLADLAERCARTGAAALLALSYDGTIRWSGPAHPDDHLVRDAVNRHQMGDKGLGLALGPAAGAVAERLFREAGYRTWLRPSPWVLTAEDHPLARALVEGWSEAARAVRPAERERIRAWARHRVHSLPSGTLTVGHLDLLALP